MPRADHRDILAGRVLVNCPTEGIDPPRTSELLTAVISRAMSLEKDELTGGIIQVPGEDGNPEFREGVLAGIPRDPDEMAASPVFGLARGLNVIIFESRSRPGRPGWFMATAQRPYEPAMPPETFPPGEAELLARRFLESGAAKCS